MISSAIPYVHSVANPNPYFIQPASPASSICVMSVSYSQPAALLPRNPNPMVPSNTTKDAIISNSRYLLSSISAISTECLVFGGTDLRATSSYSSVAPPLLP